ncbi:hypothetical protein CLAFUW4_13166 [Fulvia fulva]|uniref:Uncharacterized protein n=1 Tax=Passalora fulva TaxID=5499 RepID=A0A9Q8PIX4_PASFU|nr:uncharacterized protein CLAFUR5_13023 [Fulvia fulva]KAK4611740.1 hypothetical protein CLAFUR4_13171 [Fulvia fulva]UJO23308.1 hypothetical protein CLAFUR5_13023 [Fulvia fulva]WPV20881.1 hypothetical protein CLAFUW4_13166 [Fulvia fulva]WPV36105.1 hypothetical protein CLAFUW7_13174 [Fulvia fulva]
MAIATDTKTPRKLLNRLALCFGRSSHCSADSNGSLELKQSSLRDSTTTTSPCPQLHRLQILNEPFPIYTANSENQHSIATQIAILDSLFVAAINNHDYGPSSLIWSICHSDWVFRDLFIPTRSIRIAEHVARLRLLETMGFDLQIEGARREVLVSENGVEAETRVVGKIRGYGGVLKESARLSWRWEKGLWGEAEGRWSCVRMVTERGVVCNVFRS